MTVIPAPASLLPGWMRDFSLGKTRDGKPFTAADATDYAIAFRMPDKESGSPVPVTRLAADLLTRPVARQRLDKLAETIRDRSPQLKGFTLATDKNSLFGSLVVVAGQPQVDGPKLTRDDRREELRSIPREVFSSQGELLGSALPHVGWLTLGPPVTAGLIDPHAPAEQQVLAAKTIEHELQHIRSPQYEGDHDINEGVTETLARWPGQITRTMNDLGLPAEGRPAVKGTYGDEVAVTRLALADIGINPRSASKRDEAQHFMRSVENSNQLLDRFAGVMVGKRGLDPASTPAVREELERAWVLGAPDLLQRVTGDLDALKPGKRFYSEREQDIALQHRVWAEMERKAARQGTPA